MKRTYGEAVAYIEDIPKFTKKTTLDHTRVLLNQLGHPEEHMKIIHVAGTNGKGSVCSYLNAMLMRGGYKVGLFTSPHLIRINERFQINGESVSDEEFLWAFEEVMQAVERTAAAGETHPTYFETLFLMGLLLFQRKQTDYVILEVGMGGRLDATNVVRRPLACIITSISMDHTEYLGDTIEQIAFEKAGIIKSGVPVIYDGHDARVSAVIAARAAEAGAAAYELTPEHYRIQKNDRSGIGFVFTQKDGTGSYLEITQAAEYQMMNASLAYFTMELLEKDHGISRQELIAGVREMRWPCRMETVADGIVIDGAHNEDGIANFVKTVQHFHKDHEITILFGAVIDKRYQDMIRELAEGIHPDRVVTTKIEGHREVSEKTFAELFRQNGVGEVYAEAEPGNAYDLAVSLKGDGMLFCVGSLYLAGELKRHIAEQG